jgi:hypothetical protein
MKESEKIYQVKKIGVLNKKQVNQLVCINDDGSDFAKKVDLLNKKIP